LDWLGTLSIQEMEFKLSSVQQMFLMIRSIWSLLDLHLMRQDCTAWLSVKITIFFPAICCLKRLKPIVTAKLQTFKFKDYGFLVCSLDLGG
jgi:hypothetical protein